MKKLPFTVIGGYLGAGKTTLLNHLLSNTNGLRLAVLVNDFGSINIDVALIQRHDGDTINLANGCLCCSLVNGFATAIAQIRNRTDEFDHIIIEASGVANPAKIAQYGQMYQLPLAGIIVVADAEQVRTQAQNKYVGDLVIRQFSQGDLIILNKTDLVSSEELADLRTWFAQIADRKPIIESVNAQIPMEILLGQHEDAIQSFFLLNTFNENHGDIFETLTVKRDNPLNRLAFEHFAVELGTKIYRAKGFVHLQDDPTFKYLYQQVGTRWILEPISLWDDELPQTRLVLIGRRGATQLELIEAIIDHGSQDSNRYCDKQSPSYT